MKRKIFAAAFAVCLLACSAVNVFASTGKVGGNGLYLDITLESSWGSGVSTTKGYFNYCIDAEDSYDDYVYVEKIQVSMSAYGNIIGNFTIAYHYHDVDNKNQ